MIEEFDDIQVCKFMELPEPLIKLLTSIKKHEKLFELLLHYSYYDNSYYPFSAEIAKHICSEGRDDCAILALFTIKG